jgi:hypothetical protein
MGKFNNKISAEFHPPKKWILERALSYQNVEMEASKLEAVGVKCPANKITCKKGFVTDLAPRGISLAQQLSMIFSISAYVSFAQKRVIISIMMHRVNLLITIRPQRKHQIMYS